MKSNSSTLVSGVIGRCGGPWKLWMLSSFNKNQGIKEKREEEDEMTRRQKKKGRSNKEEERN